MTPPTPSPPARNAPSPPPARTPSPASTPPDDTFLQEIAAEDAALHHRFATAVRIDPTLTRQLVSFQANKDRARYRWYKYKEAFSAELIEHLLTRHPAPAGKILDPFAGAGTALFAAAAMGYDADGIEILPVGQKIITANIIARRRTTPLLQTRLNAWITHKPWQTATGETPLHSLRITAGAYPTATLRAIQRYRHALAQENPDTQEILQFALLCVLESVSYTRKDGQYLRWDSRSTRTRLKAAFHKGAIPSFTDAITQKLHTIQDDIPPPSSSDLFASDAPPGAPGTVRLIAGSCIDKLATLPSAAYSGVITSPPYCNRYDYTRIYALEHALLGTTEAELSTLRQSMLTCTVENKAKELLTLNPDWRRALAACDDTPLLQSILAYLNHKKDRRELNNAGIPRMVRGYFYEMACVLQECHRVLKKDGILLMVNDNVRYAGASISVDTLLSSIAESLGFTIQNILVLPQHKGNSSQQMGKHGRTPLRKSIYIWKKPTHTH